MGAVQASPPSCSPRAGARGRSNASCGPLTAVGCALLLGACATHPTQDAPENRAHFPLKPCTGEQRSQCVVKLFADDKAVGRRDPDAFPPHYLELYSSEIRKKDCTRAGPDADAIQDCEARLKRVSDYFNPKEGVPAPGDLGVALEGGGSKAAPFALGTLAGLHELGLLETRVRAISSISGGSYAASYYYNRLHDQAQKEAVDAGNADDWFRSCIPHYFVASVRFDALRKEAEPVDCGERDSPKAVKRYNHFARDYEFLGHVWTNHDLLRGDTPGNLDTDDALRLPEYGNLLLLGTETLVTVPFQFLARTVFRWPLNSAPSKLAYKLGLERQYGYTPHDWQAAGSTDIEHLVATQERRRTRTLASLAPLQEHNGVPLWIIGATAPGAISGSQWLFASPRDPLRQQFELTASAYGSGTYGYALQPPDAPFDFLGRNPDGLPILDAVAASAAFFDDDQTEISRQPFRFLAGAGQHFLNVTWFTELRNFNVNDPNRFLAKLLPWPIYLTTLQQQAETPYIHLQDGGNTENTGILPLLRRGYKTILYAHGTQDTKADWAAICHLKNQLELDGTYFIRSPSLERLVAERGIRPASSGGRQFASYLDALCSRELDASDLAAFDDNTKRPKCERIPAVAKLYCGRLGYPVQDRTRPDHGYTPCGEFARKFGLPRADAQPSWMMDCKDNGAGLPHADVLPAEPPADATDLFYRWPAGASVTFEVYRGDTLANLHEVRPDAPLISTIVAIVPGIAWPDVAAQLLPQEGQALPADWDGWCGLPREQRRQWPLAYCFGPDDRLIAAPGQSPGHAAGLPCSALAHVLEDHCKDSKDGRRPQFPQDDFVLQTLSTTYTSYAAYFDLARHQVRTLICAKWPSAAGPAPEACAGQR